MRHLIASLLIGTVLVASPNGAGPTRAEDGTTAKEAFEAAKQLDTPEAWEAFLNHYQEGFYADLARAYLKKLGDAGGERPPIRPQPKDQAAQPAPRPTPPYAQPTTPYPHPPELRPSEPRQAAAPNPGSNKVALGPNADLAGLRLMPEASPWHQDISRWPVDRNSRRILARIGDKPLHPDFGSEYEGVPIGIPYMVVSGSQRRVPITFKYADESDPGPYPIPPDAPIEGGPQSDGDRHILVLDRDNWVLYELFNAWPRDDGGWNADSGAVWDLKKVQSRPAGWTSADAAGLPILPGLVRYDEVVGAGAVEHALRFTLSKTRRAYVPPASHWASTSFDEDLAPMGMRVRLRADYDISRFAPEVQAILKAMKKYGMILADNGSDNYVSGAHDPRWDPDILRQLKRVTTKDLEVVEMRGLVVAPRK